MRRRSAASIQWHPLICVRAELVLVETQRLLAIVATGEPRLDDIGWEQSQAGAAHAAAALVGVFEMGLLSDGLPSEVLGALQAMEHVVL